MGGHRSRSQPVVSVGKPTWASASAGMARMEKTQQSRWSMETGLSNRVRPHTVVGRAEMNTRCRFHRMHPAAVHLIHSHTAVLGYPLA